ncbi:MAG TPA: hypothetical protein VGM69_03850 [Chloroflexota bacterium]
MHLIGQVVRLQVQTGSLKVGERPNRRYDPSPITSVARLTIDDGGVTGWNKRGDRLDDVHHRDHVASKNNGRNPVSLGFTSHYAAMRRRFGDHLADGVAGENVLVASPTELLDGEGDFLIEGRYQGRRVRLTRVLVAAPCVEFSRFALGRPTAEDAEGPLVKSALQFLQRGMRGYYATPEAAGAVELGDLVYRL